MKAKHFILMMTLQQIIIKMVETDCFKMADCVIHIPVNHVIDN